jgi:PAS domain S-box-containing protein
MSVLARNGSRRSAPDELAGVSDPSALDPLPSTPEEAEAVLHEMVRAFSLDASLIGAGMRTRSEASRDRPPAGTEAGAAAIITVTGDGFIHSWDEAAEAIFGYSAAEAIGKALATIMPTDEREAPSASAPRTAERQVVGQHADGTTFPLETTSAAVVLGGAQLRIIALRCLVGAQRREEQRRKAEARYRTLVEQIPAVTFMAALNEDVTELYVSPQIEALLGFTQEEWLGNPFLWFNQLHPEDRERCNREFALGCRTGGPFRAEFRALTRDGNVVWVRGEARVVRDDDGHPLFLQGIAYDITESKRAEEAVRASTERIQTSLREKEVLLEEIHHRVKNNLQVISSLLRLQSTHVHDPGALEMFAESCNRIHSMALVHERLYQSADLSRVDLGEYVRSLTDLLCRSYHTRAAGVGIRAAVDDVSLGIDAAVPLGLAINELVSNCLKHAFPDGRRGEIQIEVRPDEAYGYLLRVADDGVGFPRDVDFRATETLGMQLVCALTEQLGGTIELRSDGGTEFRILFAGS